MDKIEELLTRGVDKIYPTREELEKVLRSGKKLKLYQGFDPTGTQLHIGHMVGFMKLRQWQNLGHHVIFLIGDGTGQAGDPSGKTTGRDKFLTRDELRANAVDYVKQAGKIVRFEGENPVEILYNGDWLNKLTLVDVLNIAGNFTLSQIAERDLFQERMKKGEEVNFREVMYPLLQAYDSVAMKVDLEMGGSDQTFNMLMGRHLVKAMQNRDKFVMTTPLLTDSKGVKIGKTEGNVIGLTDDPTDLYGKLMSLPDDIVGKGFEYLTFVPMEEVEEIKKLLDGGDNPMIHKKKLAFEIIKQLNTEDAAKASQEEFEKVYQKGGIPTAMQVLDTASLASDTTIVDAIMKSGLAKSRADAKRVITQGGVSLNDQVITDPNASFACKPGDVLKYGKHEFREIK